MSCWPAAAAAEVGSAVAVAAAVAHDREVEEAAAGDLAAEAAVGHDLEAVVVAVADTVAADTAAVEIWLAVRRACHGRRRSKP